MASSAVSVGGGSAINGMPEALRQSHGYMKRCFGKLVEKGSRSMKLKELMEAMEMAFDDKMERIRVMDGLLGHILSSTQVLLSFSTLYSLDIYFSID